MNTSRRDFLKMTSALGFGVLASRAKTAWGIDRVDNPLESYPDRDWEQVYRDLYREDSSFVFLCAPNDTHNCLLRAHVKNGVVTRISPTYGYGRATDLQGNRASHRWDPRCCQKGLVLTRRFYGDRRVRYPMVRRGFKEWVERGFPRGDDGRPPAELFNRGWDGWERATWDEAVDMVARTLVNVAETYSGGEGTRRLRAQGYEREVVEATRGAGTQTLKFRGGMPLLGATRVFGMYRLAGSLALLDAHIRGVGPDEALGGRGWDNYSWHTDLPPGHTMVTGTQTIENDLYSVEQSDLVVVWGMNWITTKMPDGHWLTEARTKGTRVVVIACEYSATSCKADDAIVVRPGTTPALALGLCHVIFRDGLYDEEFVRQHTDLPLLVRMDTLQLLRAADAVPNHRAAPLTNFTRVLGPDERPAAPHEQEGQLIPQALRDEWGDFTVWDRRTSRPAALSRDQVGAQYDRARLDPELEGEHEVTLSDGATVRVRTVFDLIKSYVMESSTPEATEAITWAPQGAVEELARAVAEARGRTFLAVGMGPNQFFNNDLKDRTVFLLAALTANLGRIAGNVGSYAGNYRVALFNGLPQYIAEDPFNIQQDLDRPANVRQYWVPESAHYYNHEDHPLRYGEHLLTGQSHMPTPTKSLWFANANSILGNLKWHYNTVENVLPNIEMIAVNEWWWSTSCEYADVVFPADSWAELKHPDMTASVTNPFLTMFPATPLPRIHDTRGDIEIIGLVGTRLGELIEDDRFDDYFRFIREGRVDRHLQRILDRSNPTKGYRVEELLRLAAEGTPALMMTRTSPRCGGFEQVTDSWPWYTKTGRLELYREEREFIEAGENLPVHREPVDSTFYEPNVILAGDHPAVRPRTPSDFNVPADDISGETRQGRNVVMTWQEILRSAHPLRSEGYRYVFHTPKYRHAAHTMPVDTDLMAVLFGPFGDMTRRDRRMPFVSEGYMDINPADGRELGLNDGDYVWVDSDPADRPFRGWQDNQEHYQVARLMCRARFYAGTPRGIIRMWFNMYAATPGSVRGAREREDGLAKNPETNYQAMFRYGSHQSVTRGWLKPTLMTDSLVRKGLFGHIMGKGFLPDSHCPTGAPREAIVKIERAEPGGVGGEGRWRPVDLGLRPGSETDAFRRFLEGGYIRNGS